MMSKSPLSPVVKEKSGFLSLNPASKTESVLLAFLILLLPTQFGKHFWPGFSLVSGLRIDYLSPTVYVTDIIIGLVFLSWLLRVLAPVFRLQDKEEIVLHILEIIAKYWYVFPIGVFFLCNVLLANRMPLSAYYFAKLIEYTFLAFYLAKTLHSPSQLFTIALLGSVSMFFESLLAVLQYLNQGALTGWLYYLGERAFNGSTPGIANASLDGTLVLRPYGTFPHPNVLAGYLLLSSVFVFGFGLRQSRGGIRSFFILVLLLASITLFLTLSRVSLGLWFVLICGLLVSMIFKLKSYRRSIFFAAIAGSLISFVLLPFSQAVFTRFAETSFFEEAFVQRSELIQHAYTMILTHPLVGVGLGNFIPVLAPLQSSLSLGLSLQPVHVIYLLLAAETGLVGLGIFLWFLVRTYRHLFSRMHDSPQSKELYFVFLLCLSLILTIGFFDHYFLTLQQGQLLFSLVLGFCWATFLTT